MDRNKKDGDKKGRNKKDGDKKDRNEKGETGFRPGRKQIKPGLLQEYCPEEPEREAEHDTGTAAEGTAQGIDQMV